MPHKIAANRLGLRSFGAFILLAISTTFVHHSKHHDRKEIVFTIGLSSWQEAAEAKILQWREANLVPPDDTVKKLPRKMEPTQALQVELETQHVDSMSTAGLEQTMTPSAGDTT